MVMVRTYKRKTSTRYSPEALQAAVKAVKEDGMSRSAAARRFDIPPSTLFYHISGEYSKVGAGAPTILSPVEEREIVITLQVLQEIGFGMTKELVGVVIHDYLKDQPTRPNPFQHGVPGKDWWRLLRDGRNSSVCANPSTYPQAEQVLRHQKQSVLGMTGLFSMA